MSKLFSRFSKSFFVLILIIVALTIGLLILNVDMKFTYKSVANQREEAAEKVLVELVKIEETARLEADTISKLFDRSIINQTTAIELLSTISKQFVKGEGISSGYFININSENVKYSKLYDKNFEIEMNISLERDDKTNFDINTDAGKWELLFNTVTMQPVYVYIVPIENSKLKEASVGIFVDINKLMKSVNNEDASSTFAMLTEEGRIIFPQTQSDDKTSDPFQKLVNILPKFADDQGSIVEKFEGSTAIYSYEKFLSGQTFVLKTVNTKEITDSSVLIVLIAIAAIIFMVLVQENIKTGTYPFNQLTTFAIQFFSGSKHKGSARNNNLTVVLSIYFSIIGALFFYFIYQIITNNIWFEGALAVAGLVLMLIMLLPFRIRANQDNIIYALSIMLMVFANTAYFFNIMSGNIKSAGIFIWIIFSFVIVLFSEDRKKVNIFFGLFLCSQIILMILARVFFVDVEDQIRTYENSFRLVFFCGALFGALKLYKVRSEDDYSELNSVYGELRDTQSALVQNEKLSTLGHLIAGVAHEINTPIGAIKASAEVLETASYKIFEKVMSETRDFSKDDAETFLTLMKLAADSLKEMRTTTEMRKSKPQVKKFLREIEVESPDEVADILNKMEICDIEKIENNLDLFRKPNSLKILRALCNLSPYLSATQSILFATVRVSKIVFALKSYAHMNSTGEFVPYDIIKNIENVLVLYQNQLKTGIEVVKNFDENIPEMLGNSDELSQVWTNIIQNAIYAMSNVGTLTITIENVSNEYVLVLFTDTGKGIKKEDLTRIFAAFYTTKPLGEGSGLGLDICKKVIGKHDGTIAVDSVVNVGTTFTIKLPIKIIGE